MIERFQSGSTFETAIGYSRAVVAGNLVFVSGTTGYNYATMQLEEGVVAQCEQTCKNIDAALRRCGAGWNHIVRVHYLLADAGEFEACWPVLQRWFGAHPPAATMWQAPLLNPAIRIEIEVTAVLH